MAKKTQRKTKRVRNTSRKVLPKKKQSKSRNKNTRVSAVAKPRKKVRKRDLAEFPALQKNLYSRIKQEYFDLDYINSLTKKEKKWLNKFMNEYLNANMNTTKNNFHKSTEAKRERWNANNSRNRDLYSIMRGVGGLHSIDDLLVESTYDPTDDIIEMIDLKRNQSN